MQSGLNTDSGIYKNGLDAESTKESIDARQVEMETLEAFLSDMDTALNIGSPILASYMSQEWESMDTSFKTFILVLALCNNEPRIQATAARRIALFGDSTKRDHTSCYISYCLALTQSKLDRALANGGIKPIRGLKPLQDGHACIIDESLFLIHEAIHNSGDASLISFFAGELESMLYDPKALKQYSSFAWHVIMRQLFTIAYEKLHETIEKTLESIDSQKDNITDPEAHCILFKHLIDNFLQAFTLSTEEMAKNCANILYQNLYSKSPALKAQSEHSRAQLRIRDNLLSIFRKMEQALTKVVKQHCYTGVLESGFVGPSKCNEQAKSTQDAAPKSSNSKATARVFQINEGAFNKLKVRFGRSDQNSEKEPQQPIQGTEKGPKLTRDDRNALFRYKPSTKLSFPNPDDMQALENMQVMTREIPLIIQELIIAIINAETIADLEIVEYLSSPVLTNGCLMYQQRSEVLAQCSENINADPGQYELGEAPSAIMYFLYNQMFRDLSDESKKRNVLCTKYLRNVNISVSQFPKPTYIVNFMETASTVVHGTTKGLNRQNENVYMLNLEQIANLSLGIRCPGLRAKLAGRNPADQPTYTASALKFFPRSMVKTPVVGTQEDEQSRARKSKAESLTCLYCLGCYQNAMLRGREASTAYDATIESVYNSVTKVLTDLRNNSNLATFMSEETLLFLQFISGREFFSFISIEAPILCGLQAWHFSRNSISIAYDQKTHRLSFGLCCPPRTDSAAGNCTRNVKRTKITTYGQLETVYHSDVYSKHPTQQEPTVPVLYPTEWQSVQDLMKFPIPYSSALEYFIDNLSAPDVSVSFSPAACGIFLPLMLNYAGSCNVPINVILPNPGTTLRIDTRGDTRTQLLLRAACVCNYAQFMSSFTRSIMGTDTEKLSSFKADDIAVLCNDLIETSMHHDHVTNANLLPDRKQELDSVSDQISNYVFRYLTATEKARYGVPYAGRVCKLIIDRVIKYRSEPSSAALQEILSRIISLITNDIKTIYDTIPVYLDEQSDTEYDKVAKSIVSEILPMASPCPQKLRMTIPGQSAHMQIECERCNEYVHNVIESFLDVPTQDYVHTLWSTLIGDANIKCDIPDTISATLKSQTLTSSGHKIIPNEFVEWKIICNLQPAFLDHLKRYGPSQLFSAIIHRLGSQEDITSLYVKRTEIHKALVDALVHAVNKTMREVFHSETSISRSTLLMIMPQVTSAARAHSKACAKDRTVDQSIDDPASWNDRIARLYLEHCFIIDVSRTVSETVKCFESQLFGEVPGVLLTHKLLAARVVMFTVDSYLQNSSDEELLRSPEFTNLLDTFSFSSKSAMSPHRLAMTQYVLSNPRIWQLIITRQQGTACPTLQNIYDFICGEVLGLQNIALHNNPMTRKYAPCASELFESMKQLYAAYKRSGRSTSDDQKRIKSNICDITNRLARLVSHRSALQLIALQEDPVHKGMYDDAVNYIVEFSGGLSPEFTSQPRYTENLRTIQMSNDFLHIVSNLLPAKDSNTLSRYLPHFRESIVSAASVLLNVAPKESMRLSKAAQSAFVMYGQQFKVAASTFCDILSKDSHDKVTDVPEPSNPKAQNQQSGFLIDDARTRMESCQKAIATLLQSERCEQQKQDDTPKDNMDESNAQRTKKELVKTLENYTDECVKESSNEAGEPVSKNAWTLKITHETDCYKTELDKLETESESTANETVKSTDSEVIKHTKILSAIDALRKTLRTKSVLELFLSQLKLEHRWDEIVAAYESLVDLEAEDIIPTITNIIKLAEGNPNHLCSKEIVDIVQQLQTLKHNFEAACDLKSGNDDRNNGTNTSELGFNYSVIFLNCEIMIIPTVLQLILQNELSKKSFESRGCSLANCFGAISAIQCLLPSQQKAMTSQDPEDAPLQTETEAQLPKPPGDGKCNRHSQPAFQGYHYEIIQNLLLAEIENINQGLQDAANSGGMFSKTPNLCNVMSESAKTLEELCNNITQSLKVIMEFCTNIPVKMEQSLRSTADLLSSPTQMQEELECDSAIEKTLKNYNENDISSLHILSHLLDSFDPENKLSQDLKQAIEEVISSFFPKRWPSHKIPTCLHAQSVGPWHRHEFFGNKMSIGERIRSNPLYDQYTDDEEEPDQKSCRYEVPKTFSQKLHKLIAANAKHYPVDLTMEDGSVLRELSSLLQEEKSNGIVGAMGNVIKGYEERILAENARHNQALQNIESSNSSSTKDAMRSCIRCIFVYSDVYRNMNLGALKKRLEIQVMQRRGHLLLLLEIMLGKSKNSKFGPSVQYDNIRKTLMMVQLSEILSGTINSFGGSFVILTEHGDFELTADSLPFLQGLMPELQQLLRIINDLDSSAADIAKSFTSISQKCAHERRCITVCGSAEAPKHEVSSTQNPQQSENESVSSPDRPAPRKAVFSLASTAIGTLLSKKCTEGDADEPEKDSAKPGPSVRNVAELRMCARNKHATGSTTQVLVTSSTRFSEFSLIDIFWRLAFCSAEQSIDSRGNRKLDFNRARNMTRILVGTTQDSTATLEGIKSTMLSLVLKSSPAPHTTIIGGITLDAKKGILCLNFVPTSENITMLSAMLATKKISDFISLLSSLSAQQNNALKPQDRRASISSTAESQNDNEEGTDNVVVVRMTKRKKRKKSKRKSISSSTNRSVDSLSLSTISSQQSMDIGSQNFDDTTQSTESDTTASLNSESTLTAAITLDSKTRNEQKIVLEESDAKSTTITSAQNSGTAKQVSDIEEGYNPENTRRSEDIKEDINREKSEQSSSVPNMGSSSDQSMRNLLPKEDEVEAFGGNKQEDIDSCNQLGTAEAVQNQAVTKTKNSNAGLNNINSNLEEHNANEFDTPEEKLVKGEGRDRETAEGEQPHQTNSAKRTTVQENSDKESIVIAASQDQNCDPNQQISETEKENQLTNQERPDDIKEEIGIKQPKSSSSTFNIEKTQSLLNDEEVKLETFDKKNILNLDDSTSSGAAGVIHDLTVTTAENLNAHFDHIDSDLKPSANEFGAAERKQLIAEDSDKKSAEGDQLHRTDAADQTIVQKNGYTESIAVTVLQAQNSDTTEQTADTKEDNLLKNQEQFKDTTKKIHTGQSEPGSAQSIASSAQNLLQNEEKTQLTVSMSSSIDARKGDFIVSYKQQKTDVKASQKEAEQELVRNHGSAPNNTEEGEPVNGYAKPTERNKWIYDSSEIGQSNSGPTSLSSITKPSEVHNNGDNAKHQDAAAANCGETEQLTTDAKRERSIYDHDDSGDHDEGYEIGNLSDTKSVRATKLSIDSRILTHSNDKNTDHSMVLPKGSSFISLFSKMKMPAPPKFSASSHIMKFQLKKHCTLVILTFLSLCWLSILLAALASNNRFLKNIFNSTTALTTSIAASSAVLLLLALCIANKIWKTIRNYERTRMYDQDDFKASITHKAQLSIFASTLSVFVLLPSSIDYAYLQKDPTRAMNSELVKSMDALCYIVSFSAAALLISILLLSVSVYTAYCRHKGKDGRAKGPSWNEHSISSPASSSKISKATGTHPSAVVNKTQKSEKDKSDKDAPNSSVSDAKQEAMSNSDQEGKQITQKHTT